MDVDCAPVGPELAGRADAGIDLKLPAPAAGAVAAEAVEVRRPSPPRLRTLPI